MKRLSELGLTVLLMLAGVAAHGGELAEMWGHGFGDDQDNRGVCVAVDPLGNIVTAGLFEYSIDLGGGTLTSAGTTDIYLARFDRAGNHIWSQSFGSTSIQQVNGLSIDADGGIVIVGEFANSIDFGGGALASAGSDDGFVAKFSASGLHLWSRSFGDIGDQAALGVAVDSDRNIVVVGVFQNTVNFGGGLLTSAGGGDAFVAEFDPNGLHIWSQGFGNASDQMATCVTTAVNDDVIVAGKFADGIDLGGGTMISAGSYDIFLAKFKPTGVLRWNRRFGDAHTDIPGNLACSPDDDILLAGYFRDSLDFDGSIHVSAGDSDVFLAAFESDGLFAWSRSFGTVGSEIHGGLDTDDEGGIYLTVNAADSIDLGGGLLPYTPTGYDFYVGSYDPDGTHLWSRGYGGAGEQRGFDLATGHRSLAVTGQFANSFEFGTETLTSAGWQDAFLLRFVDPLPEILAVEDIGNDQGRAVRLSFAHSMLDTIGSLRPITEYEIYRRIDPLPVKLAGWEVIGAVTPHGEDEYSVIVPTLADSTIAAGMHWSVFMVRATTVDPYAFWSSTADSGYSLDNLAPAAPAAASLPSANLLVWEAVADADFAWYSVYTSTTGGMGDAILVGHTTDPNYDVTGTGGDHLAVTATDFSGNESVPSVFVRNLSGVPGVQSAQHVLHQCVPNPFNPSTEIRFELPRDEAFVRLTIFDVGGAVVRRLFAGNLGRGYHVLEWEARDDKGRTMPSGTYFYRLEAGDFVEAKRMSLLK